MGDIANAANAFLERRLPRAMEALGIRAAGLITQELDTPFPPASKPGESPHKRTGNLQAGVSHAESREGDEYVTRLTSARAEGSPDVPIFLEKGTYKMAPRPYMVPVMLKGDQLVPETMRQSLSSEATYAAAG